MTSCGDVDEFCRKNEITYFLAYGTLIGAVPHQGFIPWDDDIDIFVPRPDYDRFIQSYKPTDPSKQYRVIDGSDKRCKTVYAKVYDATTIKIESGCDYTSIQPIGVDIDVLPIDGLPEDEREYCSHRKKIKMLNRLFTLCVKEPRKSVVRYIVFSVTIIVRVLLRVFDRITGLNPVQVESSSSSIRGGKGEALPGGQRAATLHQDKASIPNTTHYDRSMVRRFCQRVQS